VTRLSKVFDEFWNHPLAIPIAAIARKAPTASEFLAYRQALDLDERDLTALGPEDAAKASSGQPLASLLAGQPPLTWARAEIVADSPDKKSVENGEMIGRLMRRKVAEVMRDVQEELILITPYLIPGRGGMELLTGLRLRNVRVRILTNSLESSTELLAQSAYMRYRAPLLASGVELHEIRSLLGNTGGSGESVAISRAGNYSLHAKLFVFDRKRIFIGSMNMDQRSLHLNTEIGLLIDSAVLAQQLVNRFEAMSRPANSYQVVERAGGAGLEWRTEEDHRMLAYVEEPARSAWQRIEAEFLEWMPFDREL
jgi:putative cardiolipin synthase